jgi:hypothetical protein
LSGRDALTRWFFDMHNTVNDRLGKPRARYEDVLHFYREDVGSSSSSSSAAVVVSVVVTVTVLLVLLYLLLRRRGHHFHGRV